MAESIMMQLSLAGGAVNLAFNEVLYSQIGTSTLYIDTMNSYNWKAFIVYTPAAISPFIIFKDAYVKLNKTNVNIHLLSPSGTTAGQIRLFAYSNAHDITATFLVILAA